MIALYYDYYLFERKKNRESQEKQLMSYLSRKRTGIKMDDIIP